MDYGLYELAGSFVSRLVDAFGRGTDGLADLILKDAWEAVKAAMMRKNQEEAVKRFESAPSHTQEELQLKLYHLLSEHPELSTKVEAATASGGTHQSGGVNIGQINSQSTTIVDTVSRDFVQNFGEKKGDS